MTVTIVRLRKKIKNFVDIPIKTVKIVILNMAS